MLLAVDVGNTHTVAGVFAAGAEPGTDPTARWRTRTVAELTEDDLAARYVQLLALDQIELADIEALVISSVVPAQAEAWRAFGERYVGVAPIVVEAGTPTGMLIRTDDPREVGADRVVNALAAWHRFGGACVVIDMGTATTLDAVAPDGAYVGGAIAPGLGISISALVEHAARLASVELDVPARAIGTNTVASVQSGTVLGCVAQLEGMLERFRRELHDLGAVGPVPAIATGGLSQLVGQHVRGLDAVDLDLTLRGLHLVASRL